MKTYLLGLVVLASCTSSPASKDDYVAGFKPPAPANGYQRFVLPPVMDVQPGDDLNYCQWVAPVSDTDRQVINTTGYQTPGGHHMVLYATTLNEPVGTSRICTTEDMLHISFLGGIGGENGADATDLPDGLAFPVPAGSALMANAHYLNATDNVMDVQSVADVKFADPAKPLAPVGFFVTNWDQFTIPASQAYTSDAYCKTNQQLSFFMFSNHMHEYGMHVMSEVIHTDGTRTTLAHDAAWSKEMAFNPVWARWDVGSPMVVNAGETFHVQCSWDNTTASDLVFPREMCDGAGFVLQPIPQSVCEATNDPNNPGT